MAGRFFSVAAIKENSGYHYSQLLPEEQTHFYLETRFEVKSGCKQEYKLLRENEPNSTVALESDRNSLHNRIYQRPPHVKRVVLSQQTGTLGQGAIHKVRCCSRLPLTCPNSFGDCYSIAQKEAIAFSSEIRFLSLMVTNSHLHASTTLKALGLSHRA